MEQDKKQKPYSIRENRKQTNRNQEYKYYNNDSDSSPDGSNNKRSKYTHQTTIKKSTKKANKQIDKTVDKLHLSDTNKVIQENIQTTIKKEENESEHNQIQQEQQELQMNSEIKTKSTTATKNRADKKCAQKLEFYNTPHKKSTKAELISKKEDEKSQKSNHQSEHSSDEPEDSNLSEEEINELPTKKQKLGNSNYVPKSSNENVQPQGSIQIQVIPTPYLEPVKVPVLSSGQKYVLGSINSITLSQDNKIYNLLDKDTCLCQNEVYLRINNFIKEPIMMPINKTITCNCKKTKCLKLYCDCFRIGQSCSEDCKCSECYNNEEHIEAKAQAIVSIKQRNNLAFQSVIQVQDECHSKGCNCKKSNCRKKYCECYNGGVKCTDKCKCTECKNMIQSSTINNNNQPSFIQVLNAANSQTFGAEHILEQCSTVDKKLSSSEHKLSHNKKISIAKEQDNSFSPNKSMKCAEQMFNEDLPNQLISSNFQDHEHIQLQNTSNNKGYLIQPSPSIKKFYNSFQDTPGKSSHKIYKKLEYDDNDEINEEQPQQQQQLQQKVEEQDQVEQFHTPTKLTKEPSQTKQENL